MSERRLSQLSIKTRIETDFLKSHAGLTIGSLSQLSIKTRIETCPPGSEAVMRYKFESAIH